MRLQNEQKQKKNQRGSKILLIVFSFNICQFIHLSNKKLKKNPSYLPDFDPCDIYSFSQH